MRSLSHPAFDKTTAIASVITEGNPASWASASIKYPSDILAPPTLGATIIYRPPAFVIFVASCSTDRRSDPSAIGIPTVRPLSVCNSRAPPTIRNAGDTSKSCTGLANTIWLVIGSPLGLQHLHLAVPLKIHHRTFGRIDGNLVAVRRT